MNDSLTTPLTSHCTICERLKESLFDELASVDLKKIDSYKKCSQYKKKEIVFYEGGQPLGLFCVQSGKVKVCKTSSAGKEYIIYIVMPGDFLGYSSLLGEERYKVTATVLEDAKICFIPKEKFFEVLKKNPRFMMRVIKSMCHKMDIMEERMSDLAYKSVRERLAANLLMLKETYGIEEGESREIEIMLSREDLASIVGTATETVIRLLSEFKSIGLIALEGKKIRVLDPVGLAYTANLY